MRNLFTYIILFLLLALYACGEKSNKPVIEPSSHTEIAESVSTPPFSNVYDQQIDSLIELMTLEEKVGMLHGNSMFSSGGVERLGIPELKMTDGPLGIREEINRDSWAPLGADDDFATYFPCGGGLSATWNPDLAVLYGESIGSEARARNKDVLLAPAINIIRTPLCGRNFEYLSEDPFLVKSLAVPYITGVQNQDVAVCVKHYAANNQETNRGSVNVLMSERTLREIYLPGFKAAVVQGNAFTVMGAYNKFRGDYLCENDYMLNQVLKGEWGFKGVVISDWAAVHSTVKSLENGLDIEMGSIGKFQDFYLATPLLEAVREGKVKEDLIDEKVKRILRVMYHVKSIGSQDKAEGAINNQAHAENAYDIASESVVLLKNDNNILPINATDIKSIAVIGDNATRKHASGGFGAGVKTKNEITPLEGLKDRLPDHIDINYAQGYKEIYNDDGEHKYFDRDISQDIDPNLIEEAVEIAKKSDVAVIFAGSNRTVESEAADRPDIQLPYGQNKLIKAVTEANPNTVVVIIAGSVFDMKEVSNDAHSILWGWFNGNEAGHVFADILLGKVNPSGKLPWTLPKNLEDIPAHATKSFPGGEEVEYKEGILVGYRWFDTRQIDPLYPFGYGLSYTSFEISDIKTSATSYKKGEDIRISAVLKNTGQVKGKEVIQLYVSNPGSAVNKAAQELKGFTKISLEPGEDKNIELSVNINELAYYNQDKGSWEVEPGKYILKIGNSSRNINTEIPVIVE